jgi:hypothetical protein
MFLKECEQQRFGDSSVAYNPGNVLSSSSDQQTREPCRQMQVEFGQLVRSRRSGASRA